MTRQYTLTRISDGAVLDRMTDEHGRDLLALWMRVNRTLPGARITFA